LKKIELLAPAGNMIIGMAAIEHGADAVYIGAPKFSARAAAGNSIADIEKLTRFAHRFHARVFVALNTLLLENEIVKAEALIHQLYNAGVDALIIQDMGILECDLPPISLHASTQMDNRTPEKVAFLEGVGFEQVVLARELSVSQITDICEATNVKIECFVHGALCVSYSGQCYISEKVTGRSANRGRCAQFCRHKFKLTDFSGKEIADDAYYLSLKDLDLSHQLSALITAGVTSLKIEGRLKDIQYVKNITALYRNELDKIITQEPGLEKGSSGTCSYTFQPDAERTFHRDKTEYFFNEDATIPGALKTPKSTGQKIGRVEKVHRDSFTITGNEKIVNGDGLYFFDTNKRLHGFRANRVQGNTIFFRDKVPLRKGDVIFRNRDVQFIDELEKSYNCRKITLEIDITEKGAGLEIAVRDEDAIISTRLLPIRFEKAKKPGRIHDLLRRQFLKTGDTLFDVSRVDVTINPDYHLSASVCNNLRRQALENHDQKRLQYYKRAGKTLEKNNISWLHDRLTWQDNVINSYAKAFYQRHGVQFFPKMEERLQAMGKGLMTTRYCIRRQLGKCPEFGGDDKASPFLLRDRSGDYEVYFNCRQCEMVIRLKKE
jgi:23S rRNA 5-hydroxycytidine C2501 synthase